MLAGIAGDAALEALRRAAGRGVGDGGLLWNASNARRLTETLADLRGAAMKFGQLLSLPGDDLVPPELAAVLATLRNQADPIPDSEVRSILEHELGADWSDLFAEFDFEPLAAASIGQVHAAQTRDGRDVVLKLQYPDVAASIDGDVDNLGVLLRLTRLLPQDLDPDELLRELKRELVRETDYFREASSTERYRRLVAADSGVFVPRVHRDLSTRRVLATDRIYGLPIEDLRSPEHPQARRDEMGTRLLRVVFRELFSFRFMQTDPNFANYLYEPKHERLALLDFGSARSFPKRFTEAYFRLIDAIIAGDRTALAEQGERLGFLRGDETRAARGAFEDLCALFAEPLCSRGPYDFARSGLAVRVREQGTQVVSVHRLPRPPMATLFLHRKLAGSFLLCAHIGASVDCAALYAEFKGGAG